MKNKFVRIFSLSIVIALFTSCGFEKSGITGWDYNNENNGGFQKMPFEEQETGPNLVLIGSVRYESFFPSY